MAAEWIFRAPMTYHKDTGKTSMVEVASKAIRIDKLADLRVSGRRVEYSFDGKQYETLMICPNIDYANDALAKLCKLMEMEEHSQFINTSAIMAGVLADLKKDMEAVSEEDKHWIDEFELGD